MSAPNIIDDGSSLTARQHGPTEWEFPFAHEGDASAWVATITMRQDERRFRPLAPMSRINTVRGIGYLVSAEDTSSIGQGRVEWKRIVANVPKTRTVPGGLATLNVQIVKSEIGPPVTNSVEEVAIPTATRLTYEYSLKEFDIIQAPRAIAYADGLFLVRIGGDKTYAAGQTILVQDSELSLYRGLIYCRTTQRVKYPASFPT